MKLNAFKSIIPEDEKNKYKLKYKFIDKAFFSDQYEKKVAKDL